MMFITHSEEFRNHQVPQSLFDAMDKFVGENTKSGVLIDTNGLQPTSAGVRVRLKNKRLTVTDGPFTEAKEAVGGYAIVELKSKEEVVELAKQFMEIHRIHWPEFEGACEVRPVEVGAPS